MSDVKATFGLKKPRCQNLWLKHIKNEGNKERKVMFLVVSIEDTFFTCPVVYENGELERNLSIHDFWTLNSLNFQQKKSSRLNSQQLSTAFC